MRPGLRRTPPAFRRCAYSAGSSRCLAESSSLSFGAGLSPRIAPHAPSRARSYPRLPCCSALQLELDFHCLVSWVHQRTEWRAVAVIFHHAAGHFSNWRRKCACGGRYVNGGCNPPLPVRCSVKLPPFPQPALPIRFPPRTPQPALLPACRRAFPDWASRIQWHPRVCGLRFP